PAPDPNRARRAPRRPRGVRAGGRDRGARLRRGPRCRLRPLAGPHRTLRSRTRARHPGGHRHRRRQRGAGGVRLPGREGDRDGGDALVGAAILAYQRRRRDARVNFFADTTNVSPVRVPPSIGQEVDLSFGGAGYRLQVFALGSWRYRVYLDGRAVTVTLREGD